ncbi:MAG: PD-(D/E)XK nuclease family protein [Cellulosilyticaceae bacterium]
MAEREKVILPKAITDKYGDMPKLWSYSNISSVGKGCCPWEYYLCRIERVDQIDGIYGILGSIYHECLEDYYNGKITFEEMKSKFLMDYNIVEMGEVRFHSDEDTHNQRSAKYRENIVHFFENYKPVESKVVSEAFIAFEIAGVVMIGYIDHISKEDDIWHIVDYKTSSNGEFKGDKLKDKAHQLLIYAYALNQIKGIPFEQMKLSWLMGKYCEIDITYMIKSKKEPQHKTMISERVEWVAKCKTQLRKDIIRYYPDITEMEVDIMMEQCIADNNLDSLCEEIKNNYVLRDHYITIYPTEENIKELEEYVASQVAEINRRGLTKQDAANWERTKPIEYVNEYGKTVSDSFYCSTLCGARKECKYYREYIDSLKSFSQRIEEDTDKDLLAELEDLI